MTEQRILTPASRLRFDADRIRAVAQAEAIEARALLDGRPARREMFDRIIRALTRLGQLAEELEEIADELDPEPPAIPYRFGITRAADDPIP